MGGATCGPKPDPKVKEQATIHYDLGIQAQQSGDVRTALNEYQKALADDPDLDLAHNAIGLLLHVSFAKPDDAIVHYRKAIALNPKFSEAHTNLANVFLDQARYEEAAPLYEKALADMLYKTPYIAENNLGWCHYKRGDTRAGVDHIKSALVVNPRFCLGHRNLGIIYAETGQPEKAAEAYRNYVKHCPDTADARHRLGIALLKLADPAAARREIALCVEKGKEQPIGEECQRLVDLLDKQ